MKFASPFYLFWILSLPIVAMYWSWLEARALRRLSEVTTQTFTGPSRRRLKFALLLTAAALILVALARPQIGEHEESLKSEGLDIVVLLDVSNSMLAEDAVPNRMKKAKHMIRKLADRLSGDRMGLVAFAGSAFSATPMTTDYEYIKQTLEALDEKSVSNQGTNLGAALRSAIEILKRGAVNEVPDSGGESEVQENLASRAFLVLSDGEAFDSGEAAYFDQLKKFGVRVFTIGVGTDRGVPIPLRDSNGYVQGYKRDRSGSNVISKLQPKQLEKLATATGGHYYTASSDEGEIDDILNQLSTLERSEGASRKVTVYAEYFQVPLLLAIILLFLLLLMADRSSASAVAVVVFMAGLSIPSANASTLEQYGRIKRGVEAYGAGDFNESIREFTRAQIDDPQSHTNHMNLGAAMLKGGSPDAAVREFSEASKVAPSPKEAADALYNLGKSYDAMQRHDAAQQTYQKALETLKAAKVDDQERIDKVRRALVDSEEQKGKGKSDQNQKSSDNKDKSSGQDSNKNDDGSDKKDNKEGDKEKDKAPPKIPKTKPEFKGEKMSSGDAKKLLQQLQEQEKQSQQRIFKKFSGKPPKEEPAGNDW